MFVTDTTHSPVLRRQLRETSEIIDRATTEFEQRHGQPMPADNVWLNLRRAERTALTGLIDALAHTPESSPDDLTPQCNRPSAGPVPLTLGPIPDRRSTP